MLPYQDQMYPNPYLELLKKKQREEEFAQPNLPPEDSSMLGRLMESGLGGLSYVGKILDKTFGGRAVRGVLGGNLRELASVLPLSDTLGLTNEQDTVHGTDLLAKAGIVTPGDTSWENELAGFGTEVALDPSMWVGAAVPKLVAGGLQGGARKLGSGIEAVTGRNPYTFAARQANNVYEGVRTPLRTLFDPSVAGATMRETQPLGELYTGRKAALESVAERDKVTARNAVADLYNEARMLPRPGLGLDREGLDRGLVQLGEGFDKPGVDTLLAAGFDPAEVSRIRGIVDPFFQGTRDTRLTELPTGVLTKEFSDVPKWTAEANDAALAAGRPPVFPGDLPFPGFQPAEYHTRIAAPWDDAATVARNRSARLGGISQFQESREDLLRGIPGGQDAINQLARDPQVSGSARTLNDLQARQFFANELLGRPGVPIAPDNPVFGQAEKVAKYFHELPPQAAEKGLFANDVFEAGYARRMEAARTTASGETITEGIKQFAVPVADLEATGRRYVRVPDLLNMTGLTGLDSLGNPIAKANVLPSLAAKHGLPLKGTAQDFAHLDHLAVPADVAADMQRIGQAWRVPESLQPVVDFWQKTVDTFKTYLTKVFPAFHIRNLMSGVFNMWRDDALSTRAGGEMLNVIRGGRLSQETAGALYPHLPVEEATRAFRDDLMANKLAFVRNTQTAERAGLPSSTAMGLEDVPQVGAAAPRPLSEDIGGFLGGLVPRQGHIAEDLNPLRLGREGAPNTLVGQADKAGNAAEDWIRGTHYLGKRLAGASDADALQSVLKYQIDYSPGSFTQFEKNVAKNIFPWYSFSRKTLPPLLEDLASKPWKVATSTRAITGMRPPGEFVPPWIAEGASIPIPGAPDGEDRWISSFGLPMEDELVKTLGSALHGDVRRVFQQGMGMTQPFMKLPAELATDTQMFSGRKLEDLKPYEFADLGGTLPPDSARQLTQVLANSPLSRLASTFNKATDERKGTGPTALNLLTGVSLTDVDTGRIRDIAAQDLLKKHLEGKPGVRSHDEVFVRPEDVSKLSPDQLLEYNLLKELESRQAKRAAEAKKRTKGFAGVGF